MREIKRVTIGEIEYCISPMNPLKSARVLTKLLKVIGKPLAKLIKSKDKKVESESIMDIEVDENIIGEAVSALVDRLDENEVEKLLKDLLKSDYVTYSLDGENFKKLLNLDAHFGEHGGLMAMLELAKASLQANYSDFFGGLAALKK